MADELSMRNHETDGACCGCHAQTLGNVSLPSGLLICGACAGVASLDAVLEGIRLVCEATVHFDPVTITRGGA